MCKYFNLMYSAHFFSCELFSTCFSKSSVISPLKLYIFFCLFSVPLAPELYLEPLNCTTISARWQLTPRNSAKILGYRLFYHEESQSESSPLQLHASSHSYVIEGLGKFCSDYFVLLWYLDYKSPNAVVNTTM